MKDDCEHCLRWIKDSIAGELGPDDQSRMEGHLAECPACAHEKSLFERAAGHLRELAEEPVPRHFFVYEEERRFGSIGRAFQTLAWGWKVSGAAAAAVVLIGAVLLAVEARLEIAPDRLVLAFGREPERTPAVQASPELIEAVRRTVDEENRKWAEAVRQELAGSLAQAADERQRADREMLAALELRMDQKLAAQDDEIRAFLQTSLSEWGRALAMQRQDDLAQIQQALLRFAANDEVQAGRADVIMAALARIANSRNPRGDSR